jgi:hypothetical protein
VADRLFLTTAPIYAHFRLTSPSDVDEDNTTESTDYLLRNFDGNRYTAPLATTLVDERLLFTQKYYDALVQEFTRLDAILADAEAEDRIDALEDPFNLDSLIDKYDLELGRLDREIFKHETDAWVETAKEMGLEAVIDHIEEYLTGQVAISPNASQRLRLRTHQGYEDAVLESLQDEFGDNNGAVLACAVDWYDMNAEGLDCADIYPIVTTCSSCEYERRGEIDDILRESKDLPSYNSPNLVCHSDVNT